jgi:hypothetical protein
MYMPEALWGRKLIHHFLYAVDKIYLNVIDLKLWHVCSPEVRDRMSISGAKCCLYSACADLIGNTGRCKQCTTEESQLTDLCETMVAVGHFPGSSLSLMILKLCTNINNIYRNAVSKVDVCRTDTFFLRIFESWELISHCHCDCH